jgi:hypothetical protein
MAMLAIMAALAMLTAAEPPAPRAVFHCTMGTYQVTVEQVGDRFHYRYTGPSGTELALTAMVGSPRLMWHHGLFARGSQESLRFVNGRFSYAVYSDHQLPMQDYSASTENEPVFYGDTAEAAGLVVLRGSRVIAHHRCDDDAFVSVDWSTEQRLRPEPIGDTLFRLP